jgi:hypothetical protein
MYLLTIKYSPDIIYPENLQKIVEDADLEIYDHVNYPLFTQIGIVLHNYNDFEYLDHLIIKRLKEFSKIYDTEIELDLQKFVYRDEYDGE